MITNESFDRRLAAWLEQDAGGRVGDHLAEVLVVSRATPQRSRWSSLERWLPVDVPLQLRFFRAPRLVWLLVLLALLLAVAMAMVLIGTRPQLPPFGPAANGIVVYGARDGDIYAFDPATGSAIRLIAGPTYDQSPLFSPDGSVLAFVRNTGPDLRQLMLAKADGTIVRSVASPFVPEPTIDWVSSLSWSPDGSRLAVIDDSSNAFLIVHVDGSPTDVIDVGMNAEDVRWRPNGTELVFRGVPAADREGNYGSGTFGLFVVRADGTGLRPIRPVTTNFEDWQRPALSPDGSQIVYTQWGLPGGGHLFAVAVDTGETRQLAFEPDTFSDYFAEWSPDGTRLVFNRGRAQETYHVAIASAVGGRVVDIGPQLPWDAASIAAFSPDGSKVIARYNSGETWIFDVAGGPGEQLEHTSGDPLSWQRLALPVPTPRP
jgi:dipeptidyl aminopeptidase/acylaminoacyl peptidase